MDRSNKRNQHGVKNSSDCWRTIKGQPYSAWSSNASDDLIVAYRAAGVRCRRFGVELFVHDEDKNRAAQVDAKQPTTRL